MNRSTLQDRLSQLAVRLGDAGGRRLWPAFPYTIRLDHPATAELRPRYGSGRPSHPELETIIASGNTVYAAQLQGFVQFFEELRRIPLSGEHSPEPCWVHPWLIGLDTVSLYGYMRSRQPARYIEIGSGQSTKVVARARRDGAGSTLITSIDPHPRSEIDRLCDRVIRRSLEQADLGECFGDLREGDIVFFDGSHRVLPNSDCVVFFLDVLPSLPPGVLVGIHDIYLPDDYPQGFLEMWWSEQYVLAALLLAHSPRLHVVLPTFYASGQPELSAILDPLFSAEELSDVNRRGSLFWLHMS